MIFVSKKTTCSTLPTNFRFDVTMYGSISRLLFLWSGVTKLVLKYTFETNYTLIKWNAHRFSIDF